MYANVAQLPSCHLSTIRHINRHLKSVCSASYHASSCSAALCALTLLSTVLSSYTRAVSDRSLQEQLFQDCLSCKLALLLKESLTLHSMPALLQYHTTKLFSGSPRRLTVKNTIWPPFLFCSFTYVRQIVDLPGHPTILCACVLCQCRYNAAAQSHQLNTCTQTNGLVQRRDGPVQYG